MREFRGAESRVARATKDASETKGERHSFLRRASKQGPPPRAPAKFVRKTARSAKPAVPRASEAAPVRVRVHCRRPPLSRPLTPPPPKPRQREDSRDFVRENRAGVARAARLSARTRTSEPDDSARHGSYGEVPEYLRRRRDEQAREEALRRYEEERSAGCPPGMRVLGEEERLEMLEALRKSER